ncbi:MAG: ATP-binding protein [Deltaproteobacteria bacterium]|nr:ATP-binding protein [Deltaproteobacteria bacterium]
MSTAVHASEQHRADLFVGRADELRRLEGLLSDGDPRLAFVSGPGGAGKTELLFELGRRAQARGVRVGRVDGGLVSCSELAVMDAVRSALGLGAEHSDPLTLLLVDRYEALAPLDDWVRDELLPSLPARTRVVFAGRDPMSTRSRTHWQGAVEHLTLGPLSPEAAREYLERRDIPAHRLDDIAKAAHGHPLALVLFAELVLRDPDSAASLSEHPALVQALIERLVASTPSPWQREALWCGAVVLHLSEELLLTMTRSDSAQAAFEWLCQLPFVAATPHGLALHDLVRELLDADLAWRFPSLRQRLIARAARYFRTRAEHPSPSSIALNLEVAYLWRDGIPYTDGATRGLVASTMRPSDREELRAVFLSHQGEAAWEWFSRWSASGAEVLVVRGEGGRPQAVALYLWLDRVDPSLARQDPGCASAMNWLAARGELEGMVYRRFHVDRDAHQALSQDRPSSSPRTSSRCTSGGPR